VIIYETKDKGEDFLKSQKKGYIYGLLSAVLFGSAGIFIKFAQHELDSVNLLIIQYIIAVSLMFIILYFTDKKALKIGRKDMLNLVILGVLGNTFMTVFYYLAFNYLSVAMTTILLMTFPIMIFIYSIIFKRQKMGKIKGIAVLLAFIGCIMALNIFKGQFAYSPIGIIFGLLAAMFYAFMNIYSESRFDKVKPLAINAYSTLFSLITLCIFKFPLFLFRGELPLNSIGYVAILAIFCEIIPLTLLYASIKIIGAVKASIVSNLEIPTSLILSTLILNEEIAAVQIIGAIIVVYAVYLIKNK
jgi:drug/metabolite transporter (DMT)-like permease